MEVGGGGGLPEIPDAPQGFPRCDTHWIPNTPDLQVRPSSTSGQSTSAPQQNKTKRGVAKVAKDGSLNRARYLVRDPPGRNIGF